jgi:hypothetical protein
MTWTISRFQEATGDEHEQKRIEMRDGTGRAPEIEVTPAMIEAGMNALWATGAIEHPCGADEAVVRRVFSAMILASSLSLRAK